MIKKLLALLGGPTSLLKELGGRGTRGARKSPLVAEREKFEEEVKEQFLKLKEKGLSIRVMTL